MKITFRQAGIPDIHLITELAHRIWKNHYTGIISSEQINYMLEKMYSPEKLLQEINQGIIFTLLYKDNKPLGYISISTTDNKIYILHKFYIEVDNHREGLGSQLFLFALKQLENPKTIKLTVNRMNFKAINFYFKNGFIIKEAVDFDIGNGFFMNDFVMEKTTL